MAAAPKLLMAALVTLSPAMKPLVVNSVPANVTVWPYVLDVLLAVTVAAFGLMVSVPGTNEKL